MVMELLAGEDLSSVLARTGALHPKVAARIVAQACEGLAKAHAAGVVHRDIKPANIFLCSKERGEMLVKLLDFGIAKIKMDALHQTAGGLTKTGHLLGTPKYMSPEQARGESDVDARADIWSLGVVLYEALAGETPWHSIDRLGELIISICTRSVKPVQAVAPWVPAELALVVDRALSRDPSRRFQTALEMLDALAPLCGGDLRVTSVGLGPLPDEVKGIIAERAAVRHSIPEDLSTAPTLHASDLPPGAASLGMSHTAATPGPRRSKSRALPFAAAGAAVAVVALGSVYALRAPPPAASALPPASVPSVAAPGPLPPSPATSASAVPARSVRLEIAPPDAEVVVDGAAAAVESGAVVVTGSLGSAHAVSVRHGAHRQDSVVIVTEAGAFPARIDLVVPPAGASPAKPTAIVAHPAATAASPATPPTPVAPPAAKPPGPDTIGRKFE
jgi:serine/threonine-protein kinase